MPVLLKAVKSLISRRFIRFCAVGASGVAVNLGGLALLADFLGLQPNLASAIAIEISICTNFLANELWTFRDRRQSGTPIWPRGLRFQFVSLVGGAIQLSVFIAMNCAIAVLLDLHLARQLTWRGSLLSPPSVGLWKYLSQLAGIGSATLANYAFNFHWTWRPPRPPELARGP